MQANNIKQIEHEIMTKVSFLSSTNECRRNKNEAKYHCNKVMSYYYYYCQGEINHFDKNYYGKMTEFCENLKVIMSL